jgi:Protein of unknown function (DUF992)
MRASEEWQMTSLLWRLLIGAVALVTLSSGPGPRAAPSLMGTLTCTAEAAPSEVKQLGGWKLSCAFEQAGTTSVQQYGGEITGLDQGTRTAGAKALLVWAVLAGAAPRNAANLVGVYKTTDDAALPAQSLIGGRDQTIILQPVADAEQNIAPSVQLMQLELPKA